MANLNLFTQAAKFRRMKPEFLCRWLAPARDYLAGRGFTLPPDGATGPIDYERLAGVFMEPDAAIPRDLMHSASLIHEMSTEPEACIRLRKGEACPVIDAQGMTQNAIASDANSDQVIVLNDLDPQELKRLLDPTPFQEWMLFLHPDQRRVAEALSHPMGEGGVPATGEGNIFHLSTLNGVVVEALHLFAQERELEDEQFLVQHGAGIADDASNRAASPHVEVFGNAHGSRGAHAGLQHRHIGAVRDGPVGESKRARPSRAPAASRTPHVAGLLDARFPRLCRGFGSRLGNPRSSSGAWLQNRGKEW
jgi:hypothetical protein